MDMKNVWRKLRDNWLDFWEDDELDMDKKHLSQHNKRSLLYGSLMIAQTIRHDLVYSQYGHDIEILFVIFQIRLTATVWNKASRSVSI